MSSWYPSEYRSEAWSQIRAASGMLTTLKYSPVCSRDVKQFRRLWWSCFIRHQTVALCMQKNTSMQYPQYGIPMITQQDFESLPLVGKNTQRNTGNAAGDSEATSWHSPHTTWFVEFAKLAILLGSGLAQQRLHGIVAQDEGDPCLQTSGCSPQEAAALHTKRVTWYYELPTEAKYFTSGDEVCSRNVERKKCSLSNPLSFDDVHILF